MEYYVRIKCFQRKFNKKWIAAHNIYLKIKT